MKKRNLLSLLMITLFGQVFFSCNSARNYEFSNRSESYHSDKVLVKAEPEIIANEKITQQPESVPTDLTASTEIVAPAAVAPILDLQKAAPATGIEIKKAVSETKELSLTKADKKELKQALKLLKKQTHNSEISGKPTVDVLELILAIILPPLGVLLHEDGLNYKFWLSILLTILFFFPGMIYALLVVTDTI